VDIPGRIGHDNIEFAQYLKIEVSQVAVDPLGMEHPFSCYFSFLGCFGLLVFFDVVDEFAVGVVAGVEVGAVAKTLVCFLVDDGSEMFF